MPMTSVERLKKALNHEQPDRVPVDFGSTHVTGISIWAVIKLRMAFLGEARPLVKVIEPYQMLGEIDADLREALGIDTMGVYSDSTMFGFENRDWKPFTLHDGTGVLVAGDFNLTSNEKGDLFIHPEGDTSIAPSGRMPRGGYYFDAIPRQAPVDDNRLDPADNLVEFEPLTEKQIEDFAAKAKRAASLGKGAVLSVPGTGFGDIALVPAMWRRETPGIREVEEWYISTIARRDYVYRVFEGQLDIALKNLERLIPALGTDVQVAFVTGTDFGTQRGSFISPEAYRDLYKPFHLKVNDYIHAHSQWKTFIHSCGSVINLIPDFIEAGFDILNPVQCSAAGMEPATLKKEFGKDLVFWGGGADTQMTLAFGSPGEVAREVGERIRIFGKGGGFVFDTIHNIQATTPVENMVAMFEAVKENGSQIADS
jgi:hypothetical protein